MSDDEQSTAEVLSSAHVRLTHDGVECCICTLPLAQAHPLFYSWASREGWNPAPVDPLLWAAIDSRAYHVLYRTATTTAPLEPISILATLIIDDRHAFLGPYITNEQYRGRGFGTLLFDWGMARLDPSRRCIGLDSTIEQSPSYQRRGFTHLAAEEWRHAGIVSLGGGGGGQLMMDGQVEVVAALQNERVAIDQLFALYERCSESSLCSPSFFQTLLTSPDSVAFAALSPAFSSSPLSAPAPSEVVGLIVARRAGRGYRVAPLSAANDSTAVALLQRLQLELGSGSEDECGIHIDVPNTHTAALELMERVSLKKIFASVRMYTQPPHAVPHEWVYGSEPTP